MFWNPLALVALASPRFQEAKSPRLRAATEAPLDAAIRRKNAQAIRQIEHDIAHYANLGNGHMVRVLKVRLAKLRAIVG